MRKQDNLPTLFLIVVTIALLGLVGAMAYALVSF